MAPVAALWRIAFAFWLFLAGGLAVAEVAVPPLTARVTDLTGILTAQQRGELEAMLGGLEARKGSQVAVLLVPTTQPESIEQYAIRVAEQWKLGRKGVDDGALLLVAMQDRSMRIEVGYGLEGVLPDAVAKRIISEIMIPRFKQNDFYGGIRSGAEQIIKVIEGEPLPPPQRAGGVPAQGAAGFFENILPLAMLFIFVVGGVLRTFLGRFFGGLVAGVVAFFGAWLLLGTVVAALVIAVIVFLITLTGSGRPGGFYGGGGSHGGGGGGFGGGGGGFGGGGASGRW